MEKMREGFEARIYDLTERLVHSEERWSDVNHLILDSSVNAVNSSVMEIRPNGFLESIGISNSISVEKDTVFILTPFHSSYYNDYYRIYNICKELGMRAKRGDETHIKGNLLKHILQEIMKSEFIIVNIDGRNPNVFYELGIAHALDKDVIIVSKRNYGVIPDGYVADDEIPFDIKGKQIIFYKNDLDLRNSLSLCFKK